MAALIKIAVIFSLIGVFVIVFANADSVKDRIDGSTEEMSSQASSARTAIQIIPDATIETSITDGESFLDPKQPPFIPTHDWQPVGEGQSIPRGIHVRLNLETGQREARLLDDEDGGGASRQGAKPKSKMEWFKDSVQEAVKDFETGKYIEAENVDKSDLSDTARTLDLKKGTYTREELKEALKKFKATSDEQTVEDVVRKTKFRSIDEIQTDFKKMGMNIKMDSEIMKELFQRYQSSEITDGQRVAILNDFEYYLHQIDNAVNFADMGGLPLLLKDLNSTNSDVRSEAAFVLASALQSNPKVQISAIENGAVHSLVRLLSTESDQRSRSRILAALSSLVRHFPYAQLKFVEVGGVQALSGLLQNHSAESQRLAAKAVTLVNDLIMEKMHVSQEYSPEQPLEQLEKKMKQYERVLILEAVVEQGWCRRVPELLQITTEHDYREKILHLMATLLQSCHRGFLTFQPLLKELESEYRTLVVQENIDSGSSDEYFKGMLTLIEDLLKGVEQSQKVEL